MKKTTLICLTILLIASCNALRPDYVPKVYGHEFCVLEANGLNRLCENHESGLLIDIAVISCNSQIGNYLSNSVQTDIMIPSREHVTCSKRFSVENCPNSIEDLQNSTFSFTGNAETCALYNCTNHAGCYCILEYRGIKHYCGDKHGPELEKLSVVPGMLTLETHDQFQSRELVVLDNAYHAPLIPLEEICKVSHHPSAIKLSCNRIITASLNVFSKKYNNVFHFTGSNFQVDLPSPFRNHALRINLLLTHGSTYYYQSFLKRSNSFCEDKTCLFCEEAYDNWDCLNNWEKTQFVVVMFIVLLLFVLLVPIALSLLLVLIGLFKIIKLKADQMKFMERFYKRGGVPKKVFDSAKGKIYVPGSSNPSYSLLGVALCLSLVLSVNCQCDIGQTSSASIQSCVNDIDGNQICTSNSQISFSLDYPGQTSCFSILDSNVNPPSVLGIVTIEYMMYSCVGIPNLLYYTSDWNGGADSDQNCLTADSCDDSDCTTINLNSQADRTAMGELDHPFLLEYPGRTMCNRVDPEPGDFCFYDDPGCVFTGNWAEPTGTVYGVYNFLSQQCGAIIDVTLEMDGFNSTSQKTYSMIPSTTEYLNNANTSSLLLTLDAVAGQNNCYDLRDIEAVISPGFYVATADISDVGYPQFSRIGDIQGTDLSFNQPFSSSLNINYNSLGNIVSQSIDAGAVWEFPLSGIDLCTTSNAVCRAMPYSPDGINNLVYSFNPSSPGYEQLTSVNTVCPNGPAILGNIIISNYTFERVVMSCEFIVQFIAMTGCYDCDTCAYATFLMNSNAICNVIVTTSGEVTLLSSVFSTDLGSVDVPFCSSSKVVDTTFRFTSGDYHVDVKVKGTLADPVPIVGPNFFNDTLVFDYYYDSDSDGFLSGFGTFFDDLFTGSWFAYILFAIVVIIIAVLLVCIIYQLFVTCLPLIFAKMIKDKSL